MNSPVDANGNPVTFGDLNSRPPPPSPAAAAAVFAAPSAPGAVNGDLREEILRIFGKEGENILRHLTSANLIIYLNGGMYKRYQRTGNPVPEAEFVANLKDYITERDRDKKGGRKNKRKSMKGKSMKGKSMKRKSMKRKSMKRMNKRKNKMRF